MKNAYISKGSEWHKWDLHVHTPESFDYKNKGISFENLATVINSLDIDGIAITDHWTVEGYFKLKDLISSGKFILPGIELRLSVSSKSKILGGKSLRQSYSETNFQKYIQERGIEMSSKKDLATFLGS